MNTPRDSLGVGVVNGILYAVGGQFPDQVALPTNEAYDPTTNTWSVKANMPTARYQFAVGVINNILYAVGGQNGSTLYATVEAYDPTTDTWSTKAPMPTARNALAVVVVNGILYAIGGSNSVACGGPCAVVESYNPTHNKWSTRGVPSLPTATDLLAAGVVNTTIYAMKGVAGGNYVPTVESLPR
jgi:N-acetylneuraminic acid mutarotase